MWLDVLAYTGLRRGDAVRLGRQHIRRGMASIKTEKSGFTLEVSLPILPILQATLAAGPCGDLTFIVGANGKPLAKETSATSSRPRAKRPACRAQRTAFGRLQRHAQLTLVPPRRTDPKMAAHYTRTANRKRLAAQGMTKLATSIPAPSDQVREPERKAE